MTGPVTGKPGRGTEAPTRTTGTRNAASAILIVLALGLAFRLILAHVLPGSGFKVDLIAFRFWADDLARNGLFGFYDRPFFHDYTPGYMYFLAVVGHLEGFLRGLGTLLAGVPLLGWLVDVPPLSFVASGDVIKIPAIIADLVLGWLAWSMAREVGAGRRAALLAGAIVVFNPITWFDSVVWGQVDSIGVVFLLLGVRELWRDRPERAAVYTVIGAIIKPQLGILVPVVAAVTIRRALFPSGGYGEDPEPNPGRTTTSWERTVRGPVRILTTALAGLLTAILVSLPFGLSIVDLAAQVATAAGGYPYLTVNAYNPWALLAQNGSGLALSGTWVCDVVVAHTAGGFPCTDAFMFGPLPALAVGTTLLLAVIGAVTVIIARRPDRLTILVGVAVLALAFFVVPTRVHERYLYPLYALAAILAAVSWRWRIAYVLLAGATLANMYVVLTTIYRDNPGITDWLGIGEWIKSEGVGIVAAVHLLGLVWVAIQLREPALARLRAEIDRTARTDSLPDRLRVRGDMAHEVGRGRARGGLSAGTSPAPAESAALVASAAPVGPAAPVYELPEWRERPSFVEAGPLGWLTSRLNDRPVRPDRSAILAREGGGRLDRLDLWILVVLVAAALTLRVWRLAEPYRMHFDEVYHARTATEFLQSWRYGLDHDIYEWTHPHLAKYAIAGGIVAWGNDRVGATSELSVPVRAAAVEERWADSLDPGGRAGDRLHVATGSEVRSYDLRTRGLVAVVTVDGAAALAVNPTDHFLYVGTDAGDVVEIDLHQLDTARNEGEEPFTPLTSVLTHLDAGVTSLHATTDGSGLLAATAGGDVVMLDPGDGRELGRTALDAVAGFADAGTVSALVARPAEVADPAAAAATLAEILGGDAASFETLLEQEVDEVVLANLEPEGDTRTAIDEAIADDRLAGVTVGSVARVAVAHGDGIALVTPGSGEIVQSFDLPGGAQGVALVNVDDPRLYVTTADPGGPAYTIITVGGSSAQDVAVKGQTLPLPGAGSWVGFDEATDQVHILGEPPAGRPSDEVATLYVIEPHANAVYADASLPFAPAALALDANDTFLSSDREQLLALGPDGATAAIDAGSHAFAWRLPGVLAGVGMAALLYLLTRILFRRRAVAVLVACLTVLDGMLFVQSRIAMNDAYVGLFIIAAYALFAALWTGTWRWRGAFWVGMPAIGLLLGLALASKWVAAYAIGALGILILARSALGRVVLLAGMIVVTTALGYLAISVPADTPPEAGWRIALFGFETVLQGNLAFMLIMVFLTLIAATVVVLNPIAWSVDELRFAIGAPAVTGGLIGLLALATGRIGRVYTLVSSESLTIQVTPLELGFGLAVLSLVVAGLFWLAGRAGFGPLGPPPGPDDPVRLLEPPSPPPDGWLRPGWALGLPVAWLLASLIAIPIAVYVASYVPWALLDDHVLFTEVALGVDGSFVLLPHWPAGHTGQTLLDLTGGMYRYHNVLTDAHPASSPWWAWPFDLKPVWFYQESFAGGTSAAIYDAGNLAIWWMGVPAMAFCAWQAFKRRSLGLALITIGFACQWIPWARIDRAAFQYHYYTGLPFVIMALAYFAAELWHGASRRTWLMARLAAGAAIVGPAALWLLHRPLCAYVRVTAVNESSKACPTFIPEFVLTWRTLALAVVVGLVVFFLVRQFLALDRPDPDAPPARSAVTLLPMAIGAGVAFVALLLVARLVPELPVLSGNQIAVEPIALIVGLPLLALAAVVATARDARRFVVGLVAAIAAVFVIFYPNISALPLPAAVFNAYQGLLPTYLYPFQFPVSLVDRNVEPPSLFASGPAILFVALTATCLILAYSAWIWRIALAERRLEEADDGSAGTAYAGSGR
ncbi:MAG TPA: phospholipid carrier-dependent glycosyltransferase [Candidatus Limnocylindrales bacterium]|nr:phospholipid carrier-dependent glycosyltransferase [Candidatus Limnocylindrales bacterium]